MRVTYGTRPGTMRLYTNRDGQTVASFTHDTDPGIGPITLYELSPLANTTIVSGTREELDTVADMAKTDARYISGGYANTLRALAVTLRAMPADPAGVAR